MSIHRAPEHQHDKTNHLLRADATIANRATGAMSHAFIASLRKNPQQSYVELLNSIREVLAEDYSQLPQLSSSHPMGMWSSLLDGLRAALLTIFRHRSPLRHVKEFMVGGIPRYLWATCVAQPSEDLVRLYDGPPRLLAGIMSL